MPLMWFFLSVAIPGESITLYFFFFLFEKVLYEISSNCPELKDSNPRENQFTDRNDIIE